MLALRYFKALCGFGVFLGSLSFLLAIVAIATDHWFEAVEIVIIEEGEEIPWDENSTESSANYTTTMMFSTTSKTMRSLSGLWHVCHLDVSSEPSGWTCIKSLMLIEQLERSQLTYFQSLIAFELISSIATLTGCLTALAAMIQQQPLAVLVAGFVMFFSGMFMLVGHLMMLSIHLENDDNVNWEYGYSFKLAWTAFALCLITGIIDFIVYRNFRKITEEMMLGTVPTTSAKYVTRSSPVNLQSSI